MRPMARGALPSLPAMAIKPPLAITSCFKSVDRPRRAGWRFNTPKHSSKAADRCWTFGAPQWPEQPEIAFNAPPLSVVIHSWSGLSRESYGKTDVPPSGRLLTDRVVDCYRHHIDHSGDRPSPIGEGSNVR